MFRTAFRFAALSSIAVVAILSWLPKEMEHRTGLPGQLEHVAAYLVTAVLFKLGWPSVRSRWMCWGFVALAAALEIGQLWVPGRTSQFADFLASSIGAGVGLVAAHTYLDRVGRRT